MKLGDANLPTCAVCQRPVEKLTRDENHFFGRVRFTARCHGELDEVDVDERELAAMTAGSLRFGEAFATPRALSR